MARVLRTAIPAVAVIMVLLASTVLVWGRLATVCSATKIYDGNGSYAGCYTIVNGHHHFSNPTGLTELGCDTFCAALKELEKQPVVLYQP